MDYKQENRIEESLEMILRSVGLKSDSFNLLINPLISDIEHHNGINALEMDVQRIKDNVGGLLKVQYTNRIDLIVPFCMSVMYNANSDDNRTLLNVTMRKNKNISGHWFTRMMTNDNDMANNSRKKLIKSLKYDDKHTKNPNKKAHHSYIKLAAELDSNYLNSVQWIRTTQWDIRRLKDIYADDYAPKDIVNAEWILSRINHLFNGYFIKNGYLKKQHKTLVLAKKGQKLASLSDEQVNHYINTHHFKFFTSLPWSKVLMKIRDVFKKSSKLFCMEDKAYYGLSVASILGAWKVFNGAIDYRNGKYALGIDFFPFLSIMLIVLNNLVISNDKGSMKPSSANLDLINHLRGLSGIIDDFYYNQIYKEDKLNPDNY